MERLFNIVRFSANQQTKMSDFLFESHTHEFEELLICSRGKIEHFIDFNAIDAML